MQHLKPVESIVKQAIEEIAGKYELPPGLVTKLLKDYDRLVSCYLCHAVYILSLN